jgi:hypothetical protein
VPELSAKLFGRLLVALSDRAAVEHHIVLVSGSVNADGAKENSWKLNLIEGLQACPLPADRLALANASSHNHSLGS